ncbi:zinc ribbon domain-containing protein [bacterium]|nr:zinc ribbon domain-containing protein [bacterium]
MIIVEWVTFLLVLGLLFGDAKVAPRLFTILILELVIWVIFATILNSLKKDPYYSFEFIPTSAVVGTVILVILFLILENAPDLFGGADVWSQLSMNTVSGFTSALSLPVLFFNFVGTYIYGALGSSIALLFYGSSTESNVVGTWAKGVASDFRGLTESDRESRRSASASAAPPAMPSSSAPTATSLDEGQIAARNAWQSTTGGNHIYCRRCGEKSAIWEPADFCNRCGQIRGISTPEVECIEKCGARIGKEDKFCFRCGAQQPV